MTTHTPEIIHENAPGPFIAEFPHWSVIRQPEGVTDPMVIRFRKVGQHRTLLDQCARWTPLGWDPGRWVPAPTKVPKWLCEKVTAHMLQVEP
jgi:hypothetical protein